MEEVDYMKSRLMFAALAIATSALVALGQTMSRTDLHWTTFQPAIEEFSVQSPTDLRLGQSVSDAKAPRRYSGVVNSVYLYAFSDPIKNPGEFPTIKAFVEDSTRSMFEIPETELVKKTIEFSDAFGYYNK